MNRKMLLIIAPIIALVLISCRVGIDLDGRRIRGSGTAKTETRAVSDIERVSMEGQGDLTIIQGNEEGLTVEADDNLLPYIETRMDGRELVLTIKDGYSIDTVSKIRYTLKVKDLNRISISGAGDVRADSLKAGDLSLEIAGSGNMKIDDLQAEDLTARTSGSGNFDLKGEVKTQRVTINGAGNYTAPDLKSAEAEATISGAGNVEVWATDKLDVRVTGVGNVSYYGQPAVSQSITGGGSVKGLGSK